MFSTLLAMTCYAIETTFACGVNDLANVNASMTSIELDSTTHSINPTFALQVFF